MYSSWRMVCPICNKKVLYSPRSSPKDSPDFYNYEWVLTRKIKQFYHKSCVYNEIKRTKESKSEIGIGGKL